MWVYAVNITLGSCPFQMTANLYDAIYATRGIRMNFLELTAKHMHYASTLYVHSNARSVRLMTWVTFQKASFHLVHEPDTFYVLRLIPCMVSCGCRWMEKGNFMMFFPRTFEFPISFSTFMAVTDHLTHNRFGVLLWLLLCSISLAAE